MSLLQHLRELGWILWGLPLVSLVLVIGYVIWMLRAERREDPPTGTHRSSE
jgi:cytochrome c-type biogenesis protein CcmH/NrfF